MTRRLVFGVLIAAAALLLGSSLALAKTAVTSATVPGETTAGEPFTVGFTLENHDGMALSEKTFTVTAKSLGDGQVLTFDAVPDGDGWSATLTLPDSGTWFLRVASDELGFQQDLGGTYAKPAPVAAGSSDQPTTAQPQTAQPAAVGDAIGYSPWLIGSLSAACLALAAICGLFALRRRAGARSETTAARA